MKNSLFCAFVTVFGFASPLLAAPTNPDPSHISVNSAGTTVNVKPNGFDSLPISRDTRNLQWIFDNYPKANIKLDKGTFHVSELIEAVGYQGTIVGQGENKTYIVGRGPLVDGVYSFPYLNQSQKDRLYPSGAPWLFWFHPADGDVNAWQTNKVALVLKDMTFSLDGLGPDLTLLGYPLRAVWGHVMVSGHNAQSLVPVGNVSHVEVEVKNVTFEGKTVTYTMNTVNGIESRKHANISAGLMINGNEHWVEGEPSQLNGWSEIDHGPLNAQVKVSGSTFKNMFQYGFAAEGLFTANTNTAYTFPTNPPFPQSTINIVDSTFDNLGDGAGSIGGTGYSTLLLGISGTSITIKDNIFKNIPALGIACLNYIAETMQKDPSTFTFVDNEFRHSAVPTTNSSIFLLDIAAVYGAAPSYELVVKDNTFKSFAGYNLPYINIVTGSAGTIKANNFRGDAQAAISIGNTPLPFPPFPIIPGTCTEFNLVDNNFCNLNSSVANIIFGQASALNTAKVKYLSDVQDSGQYNTVIVN